MKRLAMITAAIVLVTSFPGHLLCAAAESDNASSASVTQAVTPTAASAAQGSAAAQTAVTVPLGTVTADADCAITCPVSQSGREGVLKWAGQSGKADFTVEVPQTGKYQLRLTYMPILEDNRGIKLSLLIDGKSPYTGAGQTAFPCLYEGGEHKTDNRGNDVVPRPVKKEAWVSTFFTDPDGMQDDPLIFRFEAGKHTITLQAEMAAFYLAEIALCVPRSLMSYADYIRYWQAQGAVSTSAQERILEGEDARYRSDPALIPKNDRSSAATSPSSPLVDKLNIISSSEVGQWLVWEVEIKQSGFYQLGLRFRQNALRGFSVTRRFSVDGAVPFEELAAVTFPYGSDWQYTDLGEPYLLYLDEGIHQIRMEVILGDFSDIIRELTDAVQDMNLLYRKVLMITGVSPDAYRDYRLDKQIDGFSDTLLSLADRLQRCGEQLDTIAGKKGGESAFLYEIADQLDSIGHYPETMASRLDRFSSNISSLSAWIFAKKSQTMDIDYLRLSSPDTETPKAGAGFFNQVWYRVCSVWYSFTKDYSSVGNVYEGDGEAEPLNVWMSGGSDQAGVVKKIIDDLFVAQTGIPVNLRLVQVSIITATFAGNGPDISLNVDPVTVINLAARGELVALSKKEGYDEAIKSFYPETLVPFRHEGQCYGLPVTHNFSMMFYRTDIFEELGLTPPQTWQEFDETVAVLQANNMQAGIGNMFTTLLEQRGLTVYNKELSATNFDKAEAVNAFKTSMQFFTQDNLPDVFDFYNRFRSGEMPLGIQDISQYNMLSAAAPEIRGLWEMTVIPGTVGKDGSIIRKEPGNSSSAAVLFGRVRDNENAWTFLRWWAGAEAQARYGNDLEMTLGTASRYAAANMEAVKELPWSNHELKSIFAQWENVQEIPTVPASYYLSRGLTNAFRNVLYNDENPREALFYQNKQINKEITRKREELNLN